MSDKISEQIWRGVALLFLLAGSVLAVALIVGGPDLVFAIIDFGHAKGLLVNLFRVPLLILGGTALLSIVQAVFTGDLMAKP